LVNKELEKERKDNYFKIKILTAYLQLRLWLIERRIKK